MRVTMTTSTVSVTRRNTKLFYRYEFRLPADLAVHDGLWQIEDVLDDRGDVALPPNITLISLIERNIATVGDAVAYR